MGNMDLFTIVNSELRKSLGYHLDPEHSNGFRSLLKLAGYKRFMHAVQVVSLTNRTTDAAKTHQRLVDTLWSLVPNKTTQYRNKAAQKAAQLHKSLDQELYERVSREP